MGAIKKKITQHSATICPLASVDRRLYDAQFAWIKTLHDYNRPEEFRRSLNNCVTTLRSVTFLLQKQKKHISNFDKWYVIWQEKMRGDSVMRWLSQARNYIEKQGDLSTLSIAEAIVTLDWGMKMHQKFLVDPNKSTSEIALEVREMTSITSEHQDSALLEVERKWIDSKMPEREVLDAVSYCFSFISSIITDAHKQIGIVGLCPYKKEIGVLEIESKKIEHLGGRPPCMVATREMRTVTMKLSTGEELILRRKTKDVSLEEAQKAAQHYGLESVKRMEAEPKNLREIAEYWFRSAKVVLAKDGYHIPTIILGPPNPQVIHFRIDEQVDKYLIWSTIAEHIAVAGSEWLILIIETWLRVPEERLHPKAYKYKPREALHVIAASKNREFASIISEFRREGNEIKFEPEKIFNQESELDSEMLRPVRNVWNGEAESKPRGISMPRIRLKQLPWIADEKIPCPCGSSKSFADCCKDYLTQDKEARKKTEEADIGEVEKAYRGKLTQYIGYVVSYTIPALKKFPDEITSMVKIDIEALCEISEHVALLLREQNRPQEAIKLFRHLRKTVELPGFDKRMICMEAIWYSAILDDDEKARETLSGIDITCEDDVEVMQVYMDLCEVEPQKKLELIDSILGKSFLPSVILQYSILKAICLHMDGRNEDALKIITKAIGQYSIKPEHIPDCYYMNMCARAHALKWRLSQDYREYKKALEYYMALPTEGLNEEGKSMVYCETAQLYFDGEDFDNAIKYYRLSIESHQTEVAFIHLAESHLKKGDLDEVKKVLSSIPKEDVPEEFRLEYLRVLSILAISENDQKLAGDTATELKKLIFPEKYFEHQRDEILKELVTKFKNL